MPSRFSPSRPPRGRLFFAAALALLLSRPAAAQWPTNDWVVEEDLDTEIAEAVGGGGLGWGTAEMVRQTGTWFDRTVIAEKHRGMLGGASRWFESLGFGPPHQMTEDGNTRVQSGEAYLAYLKPSEEEISSTYYASGKMALTTHPGFLRPDSPMWTLMEASAVHELFHAVQTGAAPTASDYASGLPGCGEDVSTVDWLIEGSASAVQIAWLEGQVGRYMHPFVAPGRAAWVRTFDNPLHRPTLPAAYQPGSPGHAAERAAGISWRCEYGTWYFWYAVGEMLAREDHEQVAYLRHIFEQGGAWDEGGLANVDAGLRQAAEAIGSIAPYRNGLYDLYPEFIAQYLTKERFYENLEEVELEAPDLFETTDADSGGPLEPISMRGWKVRVALPQISGSQPYTVRFEVEAPTEAARDALHLIVDDDVAGRPVDPTAPFAHVERIDAADGEAEFLVRVANVAEAAAETTPTPFTLRIEVEGFYGDEVASGDAGAGGELPPGFAIRGPAAWTCQGGADARALFDLMTPDELGRDVDRALPEMARDMSDMMDNLEIAIQRLERQGQAAGMSSEQIAEMRRQMEAEIERAQAEAQPDIDRAADEMRSRRVTELLATFVGQNGGEECQVTLSATLTGREGGAQIIPGAVESDRYPDDEAPGFGIAVFPEAFLTMMRANMTAALQFATEAGPGAIPAGFGAMEDPYDGWSICTMTDEERRSARASTASGCPPVLCTAGQLVLEQAEQGQIAGSFQFEALKWPEESTGRCRVPSGRETIVGHFNVASTDDGYDDNSLGGLGLGAGMVPGMMPGMPLLDYDGIVRDVVD